MYNLDYSDENRHLTADFDTKQRLADYIEDFLRLDVRIAQNIINILETFSTEVIVVNDKEPNFILSVNTYEN